MQYECRFTDRELEELAVLIAKWMAKPIYAGMKSWICKTWPHTCESVQQPSPLHPASPPPETQPLTPPSGAVQNEAMLDNLHTELAKLLAPQLGSSDAWDYAGRVLEDWVKKGLIVELATKCIGCKRRIADKGYCAVCIEPKGKPKSEVMLDNIPICSSCNTKARYRYSKYCDHCGMSVYQRN